ncbi:methyl-accepting chemotaxis protein [Salinicola rhizosphaerae]|uniref:Chemotaxis transducer n=1 Tax=Salinicola rhizosphaerae TaxID=1443141 RepID=A0ABQ3DXG6_9GAMM|nr:methyl-accepting chemotaxis protein [Salinicola rhizosphaerae]GHB18696.1 chemotaxis transducer [Salinicola rhizosphaerae]
MHFKSVRSLVTLLVGACILLVVVALVGYSLYADSRSQALVDAKTQALMAQSIDERLTAVASDRAGQIQARLEHALTLAAQLANTNALMGEVDEGGKRRFYLSRSEVSNLTRQMVIDNPDLLDAFIGWEPNAFGSDSYYQGLEDQGYGPDGRFLPWWYRDDSGDVKVLALDEENLESEKPLSTGVRTGEYYLCPKETRKACIIDPAPYDYNGQTLMVTSFNVPILVDGEFKGSAGVDLSVDFTQALLEKADRSLYDGAGEWALIAPRGGVTALTSQSDARTDAPAAATLGQQAAKLLGPELASRIQQARQGSAVRDTVDGEVELYWPFTVGAADSTPWVLMIRLPESAVMAGIHDLQNELGDQRHLDTLAMLGVGLGVIVLGVIVSWLLGTSLSRPLQRLAERMREIASGDGDLTQRLPVRGRNESAELAIQFNAFADKMQHVLQDVRESSESVRLASGEIASGSDDLSRRTDSMAASLQQTSASMEELTSTVEHTAQSARQVDQLAVSATDAARRGGEVVGDVVTTMDEIEASSRQIADIVTTMNGIAFQTNLLALNASVEAARAGEQGKGFAVVAQEVRNLASRSADAAQQIKALVDAASGKTQLGAERVRHAGEAMEEIVASIARVTDVLGEISAATQEQSQGIGQVNQAVAEIDNVTQQNAAMVQQTATAAAELRHQSQRLATTVGAFRLGDTPVLPASESGTSLAPPTRQTRRTERAEEV